MPDVHKTAAAWGSLFGAALASLGLSQSQPSLILFGILCCAASGAVAIAASRLQSRWHRQEPAVEGLHLDSLRIANQRRRLNKSLTMNRAFQVAIIDGADLHLAWQYDGISRSDGEQGIEFSIDSENNIPFQQLQCFAFDLQNDPERLKPIRPELLGSDGVSKKIRVALLKPLRSGDPFSTMLNCALPGCITAGPQYYTSSLSFDQPAVESASVHLIFVRTRPEWVRAYEFGSRGKPRFCGELRPFRDDGSTCEYVHMAQNVPGQSVRVYLYNLLTAGAQAGPKAEDFAATLRPAAQT